MFVWSNGGTFEFINKNEINDAQFGDTLFGNMGFKNHRANLQHHTHFLDGFSEDPNQQVNCNPLLTNQALNERLINDNIIAIYSAALYIRLESDVVIYISNAEDNFAYYEDSPDILEDDVNSTRNVHHYMAMSRAKFILYDVKVT